MFRLDRAVNQITDNKQHWFVVVDPEWALAMCLGPSYFCGRKTLMWKVFIKAERGKPRTPWISCWWKGYKLR